MSCYRQHKTNCYLENIICKIRLIKTKSCQLFIKLQFAGNGDRCFECGSSQSYVIVLISAAVSLCLLSQIMQDFYIATFFKFYITNDCLLRLTFAISCSWHLACYKEHDQGNKVTNGKVRRTSSSTNTVEFVMSSLMKIAVIARNNQQGCLIRSVMFNASV